MRLDQRQADLALFRVDLDDPDLDLLTDLDDLFGVLDLVISQLGDVQEPFQTLLELDEHAELRGVNHLALQHLTEEVLTSHGLPGVIRHLLDAKTEPFVRLVDLQHLGLHIVTLRITL